MKIEIFNQHGKRKKEKGKKEIYSFVWPGKSQRARPNKLKPPN